MATKKTKKHYYVLVVSESGPKFVTKINWFDKTAEWNWEEKPLELDKSVAEDLTLGLSLNFNQAFLVCQNWEIESHPYRYSEWQIDWKKREKVEEE